MSSSQNLLPSAFNLLPYGSDAFRYFLFHASLVVVLAILGDPESPGVAAWQADVDMARHLFQTAFGGNQLASRCDDILNHILPSHFTELDPGSQFYTDAMDFSLWPTDPADIFNSLGWSDFGQGL